MQEILGEIQDAAVGLERITALRDRVKRTVPRQLPRLRKGIEGLTRALRAKVPAGQKAFQAWRNGPGIEAHAGERGRPVATGSALLEFEVVQSADPRPHHAE